MLEDEANVKGNENMSTEMSIDAFFLSLSVSLALSQETGTSRIGNCYWTCFWSSRADAGADLSPRGRQEGAGGNGIKLPFHHCQQSQSQTINIVNNLLFFLMPVCV